MKRPLRIALYSHDTMGLGHIRRNLLIASTLSKLQPAPSLLLISGTDQSVKLTRPKGSDLLVLPGYSKGEDGGYQSRSLDIATEQLSSLRGGAILGALKAFKPDAVIVDKVPTGACAELLPSLESLRRSTRFILGLRDILDDPATTESEWKNGCYEEAISRFYEDVWIYGDPNVFDVRVEYSFSKELERRCKYLGYLASRTKSTAPPKQQVLCLVGGGQDGYELAHAFCDAEFKGKKQVLVTGPFMPEEQIADLTAKAKTKASLKVHRFVNVRPILAASEAVVSMGGYNTVCELLASDKPALIVPRVKPRMEQAIRAERLSRINAVSYFMPDQMSPDRFSEFAQHADAQTRGNVDLGGCNRLAQRLQEMFQ